MEIWEYPSPGRTGRVLPPRYDSILVCHVLTLGLYLRSTRCPEMSGRVPTVALCHGDPLGGSGRFHGPLVPLRTLPLVDNNERVGNVTDPDTKQENV